MAVRKFLYWGDNDEITEADVGDTPPGLNRDWVERDTLLSTNSVIYTNYITLNFTAETDGNYKLDNELIWNTDKANRDVSIEINIDGLQDEEAIVRTSNPGTQIREPLTQVHMIYLTAGAHTIEINVKVENASQTLNIYHGDIFIEKWDI